jgi:hypothetical protein
MAMAALFVAFCKLDSHGRSGLNPMMHQVQTMALNPNNATLLGFLAEQVVAPFIHLYFINNYNALFGGDRRRRGRSILCCTVTASTRRSRLCAMVSLRQRLRRIPTAFTRSPPILVCSVRSSSRATLSRRRLGARRAHHDAGSHVHGRRSPGPWRAGHRWLRRRAQRCARRYAQTLDRRLRVVHLHARRAAGGC